MQSYTDNVTQKHTHTDSQKEKKDMCIYIYIYIIAPNVHCLNLRSFVVYSVIPQMQQGTSS